MPRRIPAAALFALAIVALAGARSASADAGMRAWLDVVSRPVRIGETPRGLAGKDAVACASCHAEIVAEWEDSLHRSAWTNEVFQAAYAIEPRASCRRCHAPLAPAGAMPSGVAAREGISCSVCHVRDAHVLAARPTRDPRGGAAHAMRVEASLATSAFCASCHEFDFPSDVTASRSRAGVGTREPMQSTFSEWASSAAASDGTRCQDCHMPWRAGADGRRHRSHAFPGSRDPSMLARAIDVEVDAVRSADGSIRARVRVEPAHVGHAFPTGDLFRRAELRVFVEGDEAHARTIGFARVFSDRMERARDGSLAIVRRQTGDTRVPPPGFGRSAPIDLVLAAPAESPRRDAVVRWSVDHLLMPTPMAASQGFGDARIRTVVSSGRVVARASDMEHGGMQ